MDSLRPCHIDSSPKEIIDQIIDEVAKLFDDKKARQDFLRKISVTWKRMTPRAQDHLFENITFYGNYGLSEGESLRGFNDWCKDLQEQKLLPVHAAAVKKITYFTLESNGAPRPDAMEFLKKFTCVVKFAAEKRSTDRFKNIKPDFMVGNVLGHQIRFLMLGWYELDVNDFVSYYRLFPNLEYLEMFRISIKPGTLQSQTQGDLSTLKFRGVLRLNSVRITGVSYEVIDMLTSIPIGMDYSCIILGSGLVKRGGARDCLRPFLLKSQDTLKYLNISGESILAHIGCAHYRLGVNCNLILY